MRRLALAASIALLPGCPTPAERGDVASSTAGTGGTTGGESGGAGAAGGSASSAGAGGTQAGAAGSTSTLPSPRVDWAIRKGLPGDDQVRAIASSGSHLVTASSFLGQLAYGGACGPLTTMGTPGTGVAAFDEAGVASWCVVAARGVPSAIDAGAGGDVVVGGSTVGGLFVPPVSQGASWVEPKGDGPFVLFIENHLARNAWVFQSSGANAAAAVDGVSALAGGAMVAGHLRGDLTIGPRTLSSASQSIFVARIDSQANDIGWSRHVTTPTGPLGTPAFAHAVSDQVLAFTCDAGDRPVVIDGTPVIDSCPGAILMWLSTKGALVRLRTLAGQVGTLAVSIASDHAVFVTGVARGPLTIDALSDEGPLSEARLFVATFDATGKATALRSFGAGAVPRVIANDETGVIVGGTLKGGQLFGQGATPDSATSAFVASFDRALVPRWLLASRGDGANDVHEITGVTAAPGGVYVGATARGAMTVGEIPLLPIGGTDLVFAKLAP